MSSQQAHTAKAQPIKVPVTEFRQKCHDSFAYFAAWQTDCGDTLRPNGVPQDFFDDFHIDVANFLQFAGNRKILVIPRGFLKSHMGARLYPIWLTLNWVDHRTLIVGNTTFNSKKRVHEIKSTLEHPDCRLVWPDIIPKSFRKTRWSDECADVNRPGAYSDGSFESAGVGKKVIGQHKNLIIQDDTSCPDIDDLNVDFIMPSKSDIEQAVGWHRTCFPLLIDPMHDEVLIITTRWCFYDLVDWVQKNEEYFQFFEKPAEDGNFENPLYPKRFPPEELKRLFKQMGSFRYNALFRNNPRPPEDMVFKPGDIQYYDNIEADGDVIVTLDPIPPDSGGGYGRDYAGIVCCLHPSKKPHRGSLYVLEYKYGRYSVAEQIDLAYELAKKHGARLICVESTFFQYEMKLSLLEKVREECAIMSVDDDSHIGQKQKKDHRIMGLQPLFERNGIFIKRNMKELENELYQYMPNQRRIARDDLLDALSMQLKYYKIKEPTQLHVEQKPQYLLEDILSEIADGRRCRGMRYGYKPQTTPYHVFTD